MPATAIDNIIKKSGKSKKDIHGYWKEAKKAALKQGFDPDDSAYWAYVMGIVQKRAGLSTESVHEMYSLLDNDPVLRLRRIVEYARNEATTLLLWDKCKSQSVAWQASTNASKQETINYAFSILETSVSYPTRITESVFRKNTTKQRSAIDKKIRGLLSNDEYAKLKSDGYDIATISDDELEGLEKQLTKISKDKSSKGFAGLLGTVVLGFVGGVAASRAIDFFFKSFK